MARFLVTWGLNGDPPLGSVGCDTLENAEALREALPFPVVTVVRTEPLPESLTQPFQRTWDHLMNRPWVPPEG